MEAKLGTKPCLRVHSIIMCMLTPIAESATKIGEFELSTAKLTIR